MGRNGWRAYAHAATRIIRRLVPRCLFPFFPGRRPLPPPLARHPVAQAGHPDSIPSVYPPQHWALLSALARQPLLLFSSIFRFFRAGRTPAALSCAVQQVADYKNHSSARGRNAREGKEKKKGKKRNARGGRREEEEEEEKGKKEGGRREGEEWGEKRTGKGDGEKRKRDVRLRYGHARRRGNERRERERERERRG